MVSTMTREDLLYDCVCPICEERFEFFADLYEHLMEHCDDGMSIAEDFLSECGRLAAQQEFEGEECLA